MGKDAGLYRLIYRSVSALDGNRDEQALVIDRILETARPRNAARGVTGVLLTSNDLLLQVLEGQLDSVTEIFESICRDLRHRSVTLIELQPVKCRSFSNWAMAWVSAWPDGEPIDLETAGGWQMVMALLAAIDAGGSIGTTACPAPKSGRGEPPLAAWDQPVAGG